MNTPTAILSHTHTRAHVAHETPMPVVVGKRVGPDSQHDEEDRASQARRLVKRTVIEEFQLDPPPPHVLPEAAPVPAPSAVKVTGSEPPKLPSTPIVNSELAGLAAPPVVTRW